MNTQTTNQVREPFNTKVLRYFLTSKATRQTWSAKRKHRTI